MITIDIKNAFNSASWSRIINELKKRDTQPYIINVLQEYLTGRSVSVDRNTEIEITAGVPQGSILGPTLWNILYDEVLDITYPEGVTPICYADDLALLVAAENTHDLRYNSETSFDLVRYWLEGNNLNIAMHKTEAVLLTTGMRRPPKLRLDLGDASITPAKELKYLGIVLDTHLTFGAHFRAVTQKAERTVASLSRLLPNIGGPSTNKRRALWGAASSILLYGAPLWAHKLDCNTYKNMLESIQRKMLLRICCAYRTSSTAALQVIAAIPPIHLLARERNRTYHADPINRPRAKLEAREESISTWNETWRNNEKAAWTRSLIGQIGPWVKRKHGETNYFLTQVLTGHGCFKSYTKRIGKTETDICTYCSEIDTPEHTLFHCSKWRNHKQEACDKTGETLNKDNLVSTMLANERNWNTVAEWVTKIIRQKESEERAEQALLNAN